MGSLGFNLQVVLTPQEGAHATALPAAVGRQLEVFLVGLAVDEVLEVHQVVRNLVQSHWGLVLIVLVVVEVVLTSMTVPPLAGDSINHLGAFVLGIGLDQPVTGQDAASMGTVTTETARSLLGEVEPPLV